MSVCGSFRKMICACGSRDIHTDKHIGWDIFEGGEEQQHMDTCRDCGLKRFWADILKHGEVGREEYHYEWSADGFGRPKDKS